MFQTTACTYNVTFQTRTLYYLNLCRYFMEKYSTSKGITKSSCISSYWRFLITPRVPQRLRIAGTVGYIYGFYHIVFSYLQINMKFIFNFSFSYWILYRGESWIPVGGSPTLQVGRQHTNLPDFPRNCMVGGRWGSPGTPP